MSQSDHLVAEPLHLPDLAQALGVSQAQALHVAYDCSGDFPAPSFDVDRAPRWSAREVSSWLERHGPPLADHASERRRFRAATGERLRSAAVALSYASLVLLLASLVQRQRRFDGVTNVDDFLYARQASDTFAAFADGPGAIVATWRDYAVNSPLWPTLAAPFAALDTDPAVIVRVQMPLAVAVFAVTAMLLRSLGLTGRTRWCAAALIAVLPPYLTYTAMLNFSLAAALCVLAAVTAYVRSDRLRHRGASAALGATLGLVSLSRVVAVVYLAALVGPILVDLALDRADRARRAKHALLVVATAVAIALPWWATAGPDAVAYLLQAGYDSGSVFTTEAGPLDKLVTRVGRTVDETGLLLSLTVALLFAMSLLAAGDALTGSRRAEFAPAARARLLVGASVGVGMVCLGTSSNAGTAFALPFFGLMAVVGIAGLPDLARATSSAGTALLASVLAVASVAATLVVLTAGTPPTVAGRQLWLTGTPARAQFEQALGCRCPLPDADLLNRRVLDLVGEERLLLVRNDALLNPESLRFLARERQVDLDLVAPAGGERLLDLGLLASARFVLVGHTRGPYLSVDLDDAEGVVQQAGFVPVLDQSLSPQAFVTLYQRTG